MALSTRRVLVVDDNDAGRYIKAHILRGAGFAVIETATGSEALKLVADDSPDVVVLDVKLPDMSGIDVCRRIKEAFAGTMVLQTSAAFIGTTDRVIALEGGADSYLVEPIDPPELVAAVNALLRIRHAELGLRSLNQDLENRVADRTRDLEEANRRLGAEVLERRKAETALRLAEKMELVGQLTGGIAHEFNNLLTVVSGNLELISDGVNAHRPPERIQKLVVAAQNATDQAARLTRRLLTLARRHDSRPSIVRIDRALAQLDDFIRRALGEGVAMEARMEPQLWSCRMDASQFEAAMLNLAVNARDAMPKGGRFIVLAENLTLAEDEERPSEVPPGRYVHLQIADTGTGMDLEVLRHAFEPFFTTKDVGKGSGLGLSQVYSFVHESGGHVRISSRLDVGTTFDIYLPRSEAALPVAGVPEADLSSLPAGTETILVVEDDSDVLDIALQSLGLLGYEVLSAPSGPDALEVIRSGRTVHLLFSDVVMPGGMTGYELAETAQVADPELKVLLTSGYAAGHRAKHRSDFPILHKPYTRRQLAEHIRAALIGVTAVVN